MENQNSLNQNGSKLLDESYFNDFLYTLDIMCNGNYHNENSKEYKRAKKTFEIFRERKWKVKEFQWVMKEFVLCHKSNTWYPADFIFYYEENYGRY